MSSISVVATPHNFLESIFCFYCSGTLYCVAFICHIHSIKFKFCVGAKRRIELLGCGTSSDIDWVVFCWTPCIVRSHIDLFYFHHFLFQ
uniref:Uncharacterized protein n=1 Tax=Ciona savignyi TaxID=51511 RepID=H2ZGG7_CIOSA